MQPKQTHLAEWRTSAQANRAPRVNWDAVLGCSLPVFVFERLKGGKDGAQIARDLQSMAELHSKISPKELDRLIKINVSARMAEFRRFKEVGE